MSDRDRGNCVVYVGRLSSRTRERDLEDAFLKYGRVNRLDMKNGYAFIEFYGTYTNIFQCDCLII